MSSHVTSAVSVKTREAQTTEQIFYPGKRLIDAQSSKSDSDDRAPGTSPVIISKKKKKNYNIVIFIVTVGL